MKQTAVEWLIKKHFGSIENCSPNFKKHIEQAKAMEKEQIIDAVNSQRQLGWDEKGEQYYNETFKSE